MNIMNPYRNHQTVQATNIVRQVRPEVSSSEITYVLVLGDTLPILNADHMTMYNICGVQFCLILIRADINLGWPDSQYIVVMQPNLRNYVCMSMHTSKIQCNRSCNLISYSCTCHRPHHNYIISIDRYDKEGSQYASDNNIFLSYPGCKTDL